MNPRDVEINWLEISRIRHLLESGEAREMREATGLSLEEFAAMIEVAPKSLSIWETGDQAPAPEVSMRWAAAMRRLGKLD